MPPNEVAGFPGGGRPNAILRVVDQLKHIEKQGLGKSVFSGFPVIQINHNLTVKSKFTPRQNGLSTKT